ncbi:MAG: hypothetical protein GY810_26245 [Aureispira sp.]|nr:hypothetical protein [Aureispira sp.]
MKTNLIKYSFIVLAALIIVGFSSCKKDDDKSDNTTLKVHYKVGDDAFAYNTTYTINGVAVKFTLAQFYMSTIKLGENAYTDKYVLVKPGETYNLGYTEPEDYHAFTFDVGIDSATNAQTETDFANRADDDPLALQSPKMHWSWNSGYLFLKVEGMVDTDADGTPETVMELHVGSNNMLRSISLHSHLTVEKKGDNEVAINFDLNKLFTDVDLKTNHTTHTMNNMPLAKQLMDNLSSALKVM